MLTPLAVYLLMLLIACTLSLLVCWAYDTDHAAIDAGRFGPVDSDIRVRPRKRRFPATRGHLAQPARYQLKSADDQLGAARSLGSRRKRRRLRSTHLTGSLQWSPAWIKVESPPERNTSFEQGPSGDHRQVLAGPVAGAAVPEPSSLALAGTAALAGLGRWARRRRARW
jgi:PEP-CTERM motif